MVRTWPVTTWLLLIVLIGSLPADDEPVTLLEQADRAANKGDSSKAVELATQAIAKDPTLASALYLRGREHFRLGKVRESVADFDKFVKLEPKAEARLWERGISYYYATRFDEGAKQFELYQTYHDNDVENSVWRYLCLSRAKGVAKARETMLAIRNDRRVPMMQIYNLYRGRLAPEDVLQAARAGQPDEPSLNRHLFYAHLYIGLYHEAQGDKDAAAEHIKLAAEKHKIGHYMWDVANIHNQLLRQSDKTNSRTN